MNFIEILRARLAEIDVARSQKHSEMEQVVAKAAEEKRSNLTAEEDAAFSALEAEIKALDEERATAQERLDYLEKLEADQERSAKALADAGVKFEVPATASRRDPWLVENGTRPAELRSQMRAAFEADADISARDAEKIDEFVRRNDNANGDIARHVLASGSPAYRSFFAKALGSAMRGVPVAYSDAELRAASLVDAKGGFAVPATLDPTIINIDDGTVSPVRERATVHTTTTDFWSGITAQGVSVGWGAEASDMSATDLTLAQPKITPQRASAYIDFSFEIEGDWGGLLTELGASLGRAKADDEAQKFITGTGEANNQPEGIVTGLVTAGGTSVVAPTTPETFAVSDLYKMVDGLPARYRNRAAWVADIPLYNKIRQFGTSDSHALWTRLGDGTPERLLGYPALEGSEVDSDWNPAATANNYVLIYGDLSCYHIVDRVGMTLEIDRHVINPSTGAPTGQRRLIAWWRMSAAVVNPKGLRVLNIATTA